MASAEISPGKPSDPRELLTAVMRGLIDGEPSLTEPASEPPLDAKPWLDDLLGRADTYRDGMLALLAFPVASAQPVDLTSSLMSGARGVSGHVASLLADLSIPGRKDALQTIAKGSPNYMGRQREAWNELLAWASAQITIEPVWRAWLYLAAGVAATARSLPALPRLDTGRLTFAEVMVLLDEILDRPSHGAHEQFLYAALLEAYVDQLGVRSNDRVTTKSLNASDASSSSAGDVQHMAGGQVLEAYEVTANPWQSKVTQAVEVLRAHDLKRVHIVGQAEQVTGLEAREALPVVGLDVSVLDVRAEVRSLVHRLLKPGRRAALERFYDHLAHRQPRDELVSAYVSALKRHGLTE